MDTYKKAREEFWVMVFCALLCIALFFYIIPTFIPVPPAAEKDDAFTPRTFPYFLSFIIAICTAIGLFNASVTYHKAALEVKGQKEQKQKHDRHQVLTTCMPYIIFAFIVFYGFLISHLGFIISTLIVPPAVLFLIGGHKWYQYVGILVFAAVIWVLFRFVLHVQLP